METNKEFEECIKRGLIRKSRIKKSLVNDSLKQADFFLEEASSQIDSNHREMGLLALYNAMFHATRAILYAEGYKESSHYCLQQYLASKISNETNFSIEDVQLFDKLRGIKKEVQYDFSKAYIEEKIDTLYNETEEFIEKIKDYLKKPPHW
jgi:uncharacterized protein (UPF0332 family)